MNDNSEKMLSEDLRDLHDVLSELKLYWKKQSSLRWNFFRGILYGFGFFVGSALIAAGLLYLLSNLGADSNSFFGRLIQNIVDIVEKKS